MKITDVRTVLLTGPCTLDPYVAACRERRSAAFIEIHTDTPHVGLGETYAGYFCPEMVPEVVEFFKPIMVGQNVDDIDELWRRMYHAGNFWCRVGLGLIVLNGIEAALWDLKGKLENKPVHALLGGAKFDALPAYATGGPANYPLQELAAKMDFYLSKGFRAFKFATGAYYKDSAWHAPSTPEENADFEAKKMEFVRKHVGNDVGVMLDAHMGNSPTATWELPTALAVAKALEPFNLIFLEEPLHYTNPEGYAELCRQTKTTIAGGECLTGDYEWRMYVERDCFDLGQPDASFTGSLSQFMTIAKMLEKRDRKIATHAWGAGGSLMQNVHCGFAAANLEILEIAPAYGPLHSEIIGDSLVMKDGKVLVPTTPGLGIKLTEETKRKYPFQRGSGEWNSVPGKILPEDAR